MKMAKVRQTLFCGPCVPQSKQGLLCCGGGDDDGDGDGDGDDVENLAWKVRVGIKNR
jgi:hypothetical protein